METCAGEIYLCFVWDLTRKLQGACYLLLVEIYKVVLLLKETIEVPPLNWIKIWL